MLADCRFAAAVAASVAATVAVAVCVSLSVCVCVLYLCCTASCGALINMFKEMLFGNCFVAVF